MRRKYVRLEKVGDWLRCRDTLRWYDADAIPEIQDVIHREMSLARDDLKQLIEGQGMGLAPLSASWADYKGKHGLDPRILIATGEYLDSFSVTRIGGRTWQLSPKGQEQLAEWLEYGTADMPARPHWIYVSQQLPDKIRQSAQTLFRTKGGAR